MYSIGIDIGTTSISISVYQEGNRGEYETITIPNDSGRHMISRSGEDLQDPERILSIVKKKVDSIFEKHNDICCIGFDGQMHGIVYIDKDGSSVSPLYTWRDACGNKMMEDGRHTYAQNLAFLTGHKASSGWGMTTYYYHNINNEIPRSAVTFCSIADYIAMKFAGNKTPLIHNSNAASFGSFDIGSSSFDKEAIDSAGLYTLILPPVSAGFDVIGEYKNAAVCIAIGDNQAGFISSVCDMKNGLLVNIGTGSQVSFATDKMICLPGIEQRPCYKGKFIQVGSSLCGGQALSLLERFFRRTAQIVTCSDIGSAYKGIDKCIEYMLENVDEYNEMTDALDISTKFDGTREDPLERGYITNISMNNFTPEQMLLGFMKGIVGELYDMYKPFKEEYVRPMIIGSGNGIRKNKYMQHLVSGVFGGNVKIPKHMEEAAQGAAMFALVCSGRYKSIDDVQREIEYI